MGWWDQHQVYLVAAKAGGLLANDELAQLIAKPCEGLALTFKNYKS